MRPWLLLIALLPACEPADDEGGPFTGADSSIGAPDVTVDPSHDPCGGIPLTGRCVGDAVEICVALTGNAAPFITSFPCGDGWTCATTGEGATCVASGECVPGASECRGDRYASCVDGRWQEFPCAGGCRDAVAGASCRGAVVTSRYSNTFGYEARGVATDWTDWSAEVSTIPARRFLVLSYADGEYLDSTITDANGWFELDAVAPWAEDGDDYMVVVAARLDPQDDARWAYALVDPGVGPGDQDISAFIDNGAPDPSLWLWRFSATDVPADGGAHIALERGSGAAHAYNYLSAVWDYATEFFGHRADASLVMWLGMGTGWSCGACFVNSPTPGENSPFASQIFYPADADEAYWSGAVLAHELGHWVMSTYGVSPGEGGQHIFGIPSHPGLAWSEGFATWFSTVARSENSYYDKQNGLFLWIDYQGRRYSGGQPWYRPDAAYGLEQLLDENEVTRMLIGLTDDQTFPRMFAALSSARMTQAPFLRGYLRRTWNGLDANGLPLPAWSTDQSAPHLADFLDALVCDGAVGTERIDAQTEPWFHYPYPSLSPLCRRASLPIEVAWSAAGATVRWLVPLTEDLALTPTPSGAPRVVPAGSPPGELFVSVPVPAGALGLGGEPGLRVTTRGDGWAIDGTSRPERATPIAPLREGPRVVLHGRDLGRAIRLGPEAAGR